MEITKELVINLYCKKRYPAIRIADELNCSSSLIYNKLKLWGIKTRDVRACQNSIIFDKDLMFDLYVIQKNPCKKIANKLNCSEESVRRFLIKNNIKRRDKTVNFGGQNKGILLSNEMKRSLSKHRKIYYQNNSHWNQGNKTSIETRKKISQTLLDGRTPAESYYGKDWRVQRTSCLQRDNFTCQQCGSNKQLEVHHWNPYRFCYDNSLDNLVVFCSKCHIDKHLEYKREGFIQEKEIEFYENV